MGLAQQQAALARLCVDGALRRAFLDDPVREAGVLGLDDSEARALAEQSGASLDSFAGSLVSKRRGDALKLLPLTAQALALANGAPRVFDAYIAKCRGSATSIREDAIGFAAFLHESARSSDAGVAGAAEVARMEAVTLRLARASAGLSVCFHRYDPRDVLRARGGPTRSDSITRAAIAVAWRIGRRGPIRRVWIRVPRVLLHFKRRQTRTNPQISQIAQIAQIRKTDCAREPAVFQSAKSAQSADRLSRPTPSRTSHPPRPTHPAAGCTRPPPPGRACPIHQRCP